MVILLNGVLNTFLFTVMWRRNRPLRRRQRKQATATTWATLCELAARILFYVPFRRQEGIFHGLCYTGREVLSGTRNISMGPP